MADNKKNRAFILERRFVPEGTLVLQEGDPGNCAYLIQSGSVIVYTEKNGRELVLATLEMGQIFGEMALVFDEPRTASVKATTDCNLIVITRETFRQKLLKSDPTIRAIVEMLGRRVVSANNNLVTSVSGALEFSDSVRAMYQNVLTALPRSRQRSFQSSVLPHVEAMIDSIRKFEEDQE